MSHVFRFGLIVSLVILTSCAKNPVTGRPEFQFIGAEKEIKMGESHYLHGQQASGGKYTLDPELSAYVDEVGKKLVSVSSRPSLPFEFVVLNDSVPNAWALPGGKIAVNRGLLTKLHNEAELAAVLGHEITHAAARHGAKSMERQLILSTSLAATNVALATASKDKNSGLTNGALMAGAGVAAGLVSTKYSREAELEADAYGMDYMVKAGYDPSAAVSLQQTFVKLSENKSTNWAKGLFASHPPSQERANTNLIRAKTMPKGLTLGQERYQQKIAQLKQREPAYDEYDKGVAAYKKGDLGHALQLANNAIQKEPKEALFYGLKGDVLAKQNVNDQALEAYQHAIARDANYFYYFHQRGILLDHMGRKQEAKLDLQHSQQLLPTDTADQLIKKMG
ncbi:MAG: hypothetical protein BGO43_01010 [Gammaproteobacteria bacterium 39-13]|nr:M48 family metalloprotease [Gammaproteobacteria bacterium]OJV85581.1 MAG: hypothetical protein BGO43_01010 [Gammaproteobacteria bacterium 39-13]